MNGYLLDRRRGGKTHYRILIYSLGGRVEDVEDFSKARISAAEVRQRYTRDTYPPSLHTFLRTPDARRPAWITAEAWSSFAVHTSAHTALRPTT